VEVRELRLDVFSGPARGSSQFIVTKRAGTSQFEAAAGDVMRVKERWSGRVRISRSNGGVLVSLQAKEKGRKMRSLPPLILWYGDEVLLR